MIERNSDQPNPDNGMKYDANDLDWMAFCYIADELDGAQRARFEARLENDELAQQAVVDAVGQAQVLYSSLNSTSFNDVKEPVAAVHSTRVDRKRHNRALRLFASAAAMLILVTGWLWFSNTEKNNSIELASAESDRLAAAWIDTLAVMSDEELDDFIEEEAPVTDLIDEESDNWMLVALTDLEESEGLNRETN